MLLKSQSSVLDTQLIVFLVKIFQQPSSPSSRNSYSILLLTCLKFLILSFFFNSFFFGTLQVNAFNVDLPSVLTHRGPSSSMFGFSVAQHRDSNVSWILVGAPAADSRQPGVTRGGGVFRCSCVQSDTCQLIPFDRTGNNQVDGRQIDEKSGQWFGATVKSSGDDGIILACAPRYVWFSANKKRRDPVGTCYIAKDSFTEFTEYSPCRTPRWGYHRQGSCQLGLGADVDSIGRRTFLGAVGSWYWQGQLFMVDSRKSAAGDSPKVPFYQFIPPGQLYSQSTSSRPDIRWTREGPSLDDDSYLGYSVATGEFSGDGDSDVAVGMPRGNNLTGRVVIYSSELTNLHNVSGEQIGAYFGYCLAVLDVDGDGLDDLVIGAPMYTDFADPAMKIETGRVYIVYQNRRVRSSSAGFPQDLSNMRKFKDWDSIDGTVHKGRFGLSLCSLGDINRDGYDDFAVGAPYGGPDGQGAVYIYQGTKEHIPTKREYTQVIYSSSLPYPVQTFGFSLSGGKDMDGNGYPDLVVGAYDSDVIAYYRSRPVVQLRSKLTYTTGKQINLDEKRCLLADRQTRVSCFNLTLCMSYDGYGADDIIDFNIQYLLDSKKINEHRLFFMDHENLYIMNQTLQLKKGAQRCVPTRVFVKNNIRDKLTSLETDLHYSMIERRARQLSPVIDFTASTVEKASVSIQKNCGPDNICIPDLRLKVKQSNKVYVFGSSQSIWVDIEVYNNGEDSFESAVYAQVPQGLDYVNFDRLDTRKDIVILCSPPKPETNNTIKCDMGNPLPTFATAKVRLNFKPESRDSEMKSAYSFSIYANSTNPENSNQLFDNYQPLAFAIKIDTNLVILGTSKHEPVIHNVSLYRVDVKKNESNIGPEVIHIYEVKCAGPSRIEEARVDILWPSFTKDGQHNFLYLMEQPDVEVVDSSSTATSTCDAVDYVNPLNVKVLRTSKTATLESDTRRIEESSGRGGAGSTTHHSNEFSWTEKDGSSGTYYRNTSTTTHTTRTDTYGGRSGGTSFSSSSSGSTGGTTDLSGTSAGRGAIYSGSSYESNGIRGSGGTTQLGGSSSSSSYDGQSSGNFGQANYGEGQGHVTSVGRGSGGSSSQSSYGSSYGSGGGVGGAGQSYGTRGQSTYESSSSYGSSYGTGTQGREEYPGSHFGARPTLVSSSEEDDNYLDYGNGNGNGNGYNGNGNGYRRGRPQHDSSSSNSVALSRRHKRDTRTAQVEKTYEDDIANSCQDAKCIRIRCKITSLSSGQSVFFKLRGRVYSDTFRDQFPGVNVNVTSKLLTRVTKLPYNVSPASMGYKSHEVSTKIEESEAFKGWVGIPWWWILLAVLGGLLILLILIYCLYKCGFFKRRRPHTGPEGQPLHRNGR